jgi:hypothetical protein
MDAGEMKPSLQLGLAQMLQMSNANQGNNNFQSALANGISMSDPIQVWWQAGRGIWPGQCCFLWSRERIIIIRLWSR